MPLPREIVSFKGINHEVDRAGEEKKKLHALDIFYFKLQASYRYNIKITSPAQTAINGEWCCSEPASWTMSCQMSESLFFVLISSILLSSFGSNKPSCSLVLSLAEPCGVFHMSISLHTLHYFVLLLWCRCVFFFFAFSFLQRCLPAL